MDHFKATLAGITISFASKPGLPAWDRLTPACALLAKNVDLAPNDRVLWLGCGHAAGAAMVAKRHAGARLTLLDRNILAVQAARETLEINACTNAQVLTEFSSLPGGESAFDAVVIDLPKGRKLAQRYLLEAWVALKQGGKLYLAGARDEGMLSSVRDGEALFGSGNILEYKKGSRVVAWTRPASCQEWPTWAETPGIAPGTWHEFSISTPAGAFELSSLPGVFAYDHLDEGTDLLLRHIHQVDQATVLDLGCGYGIIGLSASRGGAKQVDFVDTDLLAVACVKRNLERYPVSGARVLAQDGSAELESAAYDLILTNPPFHAGKGVEYTMTEGFIKDSRRILKTTGRLLLVANAFIPYDRLMKQFFRNVVALERTKRFCVWEASNE